MKNYVIVFIIFFVMFISSCVSSTESKQDEDASKNFDSTVLTELRISEATAAILGGQPLKISLDTCPYILGNNLISFCTAVIERGGDNVLDTIPFLVAYILANDTLGGCGYHTVHFCLEWPGKPFSEAGFMITKNGEICGCRNANHAILSATEYYREPRKFKKQPY